MKANILNLILVVAFAVTTASCKAQNAQSNRNVEETVVTFLVDCTDTVLLNDIEADMRADLLTFFTNLNVAKVVAGEKLTVKVGVIDDSDRLTLKSASVTPVGKKASNREKNASSKLDPLFLLVSQQLKTMHQQSQREMKSSPIIDVMLKAFREMSPESSREVLCICSDGAELSLSANFYKNIPTTDEAVAKVVAKLDATLLEEAKAIIEDTDPQVVFVLKSNPKVPASQLKLFYSKLLAQFGVNSVSFIDNLSNNPKLN